MPLNKDSSSATDKATGRSSASHYATSLIQGATNSFNRHFFAITKLFLDAKQSPREIFREDPKIILKNYHYRIIQQVGVVSPCLEVRRRLRKNDPDISNLKLSAITATIEAPFSARLEASANQEALRKLGKDLSSPKVFSNVVKLSLAPLWFRSLAVWLGNNFKSDNMAIQAGIGGAAGGLSTFFDSFNNIVVRISSENKSMAENYKATWKEIKFSTIRDASPPRIIAGMIASTILSEKTGVRISGIIDSTFFEKEVPSSAVKMRDFSRLKPENQRGKVGD